MIIERCKECGSNGIAEINLYNYVNLVNSLLKEKKSLEAELLIERNDTITEIISKLPEGNYPDGFVEHLQKMRKK